ncbi:unnamed protein product [Darwinula stevensoni]|uniref:Major facilitator superfamily (MFS) profile domain-containing protein n=1 Tax=Darwinula stevensoni TaxID=69355 RepID=A0A7R8ZZ37_9CRUS|nr:unnamed protein product [Darwinula stevensoni]CAG0882703.1 unnamed protein product [Darwinula stevensoni]
MQGWVLSSFAFGYLTTQLVGATAGSSFGGKKVLLFAVLLWSLTTVVTPLVASNIYVLILTRILLGLGEGLGLPTIFHIFAHGIPVEERSRAFGYLIAAGSVGQVVASLVTPHIAWEQAFYLFGFLGLSWVLLWAIFYEDSHAQPLDHIPFVLPKVTKLNVPWTEFLIHWPLWAIYIAHFAMNWSNYIIMQWLPTYLSRDLGANITSMSLTAVPYLVNSLVGVVAGHWADKLISNRWTVLSVRRLMTAVGLIGPAIFLLAFCAVGNLALAVMFISISMGLCACNSAGHMSNHVDVAPNHSGVTFAVSNTLVRNMELGLSTIDRCIDTTVDG